MGVVVLWLRLRRRSDRRGGEDRGGREEHNLRGRDRGLALLY